METLGAIVVFCAAVLAALQTDSMAPGLAGMSVSYAIQVGYLSYCQLYLFGQCVTVIKTS